MKIVEIIELGQRQSLIQREGKPISELIKTDMLIKELNKQLGELCYSIVKHPIGSNCKENKRVTYCYQCGTNVRSQKYCHGCGRRLLWNNAQ